MQQDSDLKRAHVIGANVANVRERIALAAEKAGREPDSIHLVAIAKSRPVDDVLAAMQAGLTDFGENRIEEALPKMASAPKHIRWHVVGHIQSRKAKLVAQAGFELIHSVDSVKLARRLSENACASHVQQPVLLECNVSGEPAKAGFGAWHPGAWMSLASDFSEILDLPGIKVQGLMTLAPLVMSGEAARPVFGHLRDLLDHMRVQLPRGSWEHLSMGMTDDYEAAIAEGATLLRIGRAIFGQRG